MASEPESPILKCSMRLLVPTLILLSYITLSLIWWLPCRTWVKCAAVCTLLAIGLKYIVYEKIGGSFIAPAFPPSVLLSLEFLYTAMVILAFLLVIKDGIALLLFISRILGSSWQLPLQPELRAVLLVATALSLSFFATWQSIRVPKVRTVEIPLVGLPQPLDGFSLVQLSDLHIGLVLKRAWLKEVVAKTNNLDADLVVLTGDMIDGTPQALGDEIAPLADLRARHGVYGITGNHEYYFGAQQWTATFSSLGVTMLHNQYRRFPIQGHDLILAGVPDPAARHFNDSGPDRTFLQTLPQGTRILLQHRPSGTPDTYGIDLQLSGHTHGGHLLFLKWLIGSYNGGLIDGLFDLNGSKLYVSPGTGVWAGFSCRLGVPSEITRIILRRQEHEQITQRQESHSHTNTDATRVVHLRP